MTPKAARNKRKLGKVAARLVILLLLVAEGMARAASSTWVGNGSQAYGQAIWGGLANWANNSPADGAGYTATFGNSFNNGYNCIVNTARTIGNITYTDPANANDFTLSKHANDYTLTLNNSNASPVINITQSGRTLTINPRVGGTGGLTKAGPGTLILNTNNTISGNAIINGGTLVLGHSLALQNSVLDTANSVAGSASAGLRVTVSSLTLGGLSGNKDLASVFTTSAGGYDTVAELTLNPGGGVAPSYSGIITDGASGMRLTKTGAGSQTLSGINIYSGETTINAGKLVGVVGGASPNSTVILNATAATNSISITDNTKGWTNAGMTFNADGVLEFNFGAVAPSPTIAPLVVSGAANFNATPVVMIVGSSLAVGVYPLMTWGSVSGTIPTAAAAVTLPDGAGASLSNSATTLYLVINVVPPIVKADNADDLNLSTSWVGSVVPGPEDMARWDATVTGPNTTVLGADTTWRGMQIANPAGLVTINAGNTLTLGAAGTDIDLSAATADLTLNCDLALSAAHLWNVATGRTLTLGGLVSGAFPVTKQGDGTVILSGAVAYSGATIISAGTMSLTGNRTVAPITTPGLDLGGTNAPLAVLNIGGDLPMGGTQVRVGVNGPGTVNHTNGQVSFTSGNQLTVGITANMPGIYNLSGGMITTVSVANRGVILGVNANCSGTFNLGGAGMLTMGGTSVLQIARSEGSTAAAGSTGIFNQTGGTAIVGELRMGGANATAQSNATAQLNLSGGTFSAAGFTALSGGNNSVSAINISGSADVTLPAFPTARGTGTTATITFDGGTLRPAAPSAAYMGGLTSAKIKAGGAAFNVDGGRDITITQGLLADEVSTGGGLTKAGDGALTLRGTNTYAGPTLVNGGTLNLFGPHLGGGSITLADGAKLNVETSAAKGTLRVAGLSLGSGDGFIKPELTLSGDASSTPLIYATNLMLNSAVIINLNLLGLKAGQQIPLIQYENYIENGGWIDEINLPPGVSGEFIENAANSSFDLLVTQVNPLIWMGATTDWDINMSFNWTNPVSGFVEVYREVNGLGYPVRFDDSGINTMINLTVPLSPGGITVTGSLNNYNFSGAGKLTGAGGVVKEGTNTLVLNTANDFTGPVEIRGGMVVVSNNAGLGTGAGGTIITNGGTLDISGRNLQYEPITVSGSGVGGNGAIINNGAGQQNATRWITLANDTIVAANNRWDIRGTGGAGSFNGELNLNGFTLTKLGAAQMSIVDSTATNAGNIVAQGGILAITRSKVEGPGFIDVGAATLQMENSSTGYLAKPLIFNQGTLRMGGNSFVLDSAITNVGGVTVQVGTGLTLTLSNSITGNGWLFKANSNGTLRLTQPSTYTGGTTNALGTIFIGHDQAAGSGVIALTGSGVNLASDDTTPHILANDLIVGQNLTIGHLVNTGSLTFQNSVSIANGIRAIRINSDVIWEGPVGDGAISDKRGPGNLVFKGIANFNLDSPFELEEGTVTIDGGSLTNIDAFRIMCTNVNGVARLVITNGGSLVLTKAGANLRPGYSPGGDATATNIVDIAGLVRMAVGGSGGLVSIGANSARSIVNLFAGGVLETRQVNHAANTSEFNFDGGTLKASEGNLGSTFMQGLTLATIRDGGAIIDTAGFDITIGQPLVANGTGGLAKNGAGVLRLTGANSYTGPTVVNEGLLSVASSQSGGGAFTVAANAALRFSAVPGVTLNTPQITLGGDVLEFDLGANVTPAVPLVSAAAWSAPGAITINILGTNILGTNFVAGQAIALADFGTVLPTTTLGTLPTGVSGTLSNDNDNAVLYLVVTGSARALAWGGELNSIWDINNSVNWTNLATGLWDVYLETPAFGDRVLFDDRAANLTVDVATDVKPVEMAVNSTKNYSIGGAGKITGSVTLGKYGSGALELTSANSYTGGTLLGAGRLNVGHGEALGSGALTLNGGVTLGTAGGAQVITNSLSFGSGSGNIFIDTTGGDLNLTGPLALGAGLELQKTGPNTLKFGPGNISVIGSGMGLDVLNGTVVLDGAAFTNENDGVRLQADGADVSMVRITNGGIWSIGTVGGNPNLVLGSTANKTGSNHVHLSSGKIVFGLSGVQLLVANTANTIGTVVQDGGEITWVGSTNVARGVALGAAAGAQAQYHLNGGVLDTPRVRRVNGTGSFRFNGGTLRANTDLFATTFMDGLTAATVGDGGANIDTAGYDITIAQPLLADGTGGLAKLGAGTLNLTGDSTYTGLTVVSNGTLGGTGSLQSPTLVETGGALAPGNAGIGTLTINNALTLAGTTVMEINRANAQKADLVTGITTLTAGGTLIVTNVGEALQLGDTFQLFGAGNFAGGFANLILPALTNPDWRWDTSKLLVNGTVTVAPATLPPDFNRLRLPVLAGGTATVQFTGLAGRDYILLRALAVEGPWTPIRTNTASPEGFIEFFDASAPPTNSFYKTQEQP